MRSSPKFAPSSASRSRSEPVEDAMMVSGRSLSRMLPELHSILNLLEGGFGQLKVLVLGDIMLYRYIHGDVERISPEAPVPVLRHARRYERAGGAANVAMNLAGLGCHTFLGGFWGSDSEQAELAAILERAGIDTVGG